MSLYDEDGSRVEAVYPDIYNDEEPASSEEVSATSIYLSLLSMCSTPGQFAAAQSILGVDSRKPCEIALSLKISRQRFHALKAQARQRLTLIKGGLTADADK